MTFSSRLQAAPHGCGRLDGDDVQGDKWDVEVEVLCDLNGGDAAGRGTGGLIDDVNPSDGCGADTGVDGRTLIPQRKRPRTLARGPLERDQCVVCPSKLDDAHEQDKANRHDEGEFNDRCPSFAVTPASRWYVTGIGQVTARQLW